MINRIRDVRRQKGLTLAAVAAACDPPTTAQTVGRLETGMRNLSLDWMNRIAAALGVEPELLLKGEAAGQPMVVARLSESGAEALPSPRDAILPVELGGDAPLVCLAVDAPQGEYRAGDQLWLRQMPPGEAPKIINRDVLVPRSGGRFAFGRLIDRQGTLVGLLPPGAGQRQVAPEEAPKIINRDVLVPRSGGRFAFGRLIDRQGTLVGLLPPGAGQRQIVVDNPAWLAVAEMLVRKL